MIKSLIIRCLAAVSLVIIPFAITWGLTWAILQTGVFPEDFGKWKSIHLFAQVFIQASVFMAVAYIAVKKFSAPIFGWGEQIHPMDVMLALFGWFLVSIFTAALVKLLNLDIEQLKQFDINTLRGDWYFFAFSVALIAPIYEEIIFRGMVLRLSLPQDISGGKLKIPSIIFGVVFTSLVFAVTHERQAWLPVFILSLYLSAIAVYKRNIMISIIVHSFQNFLMTFKIFFLD